MNDKKFFPYEIPDSFFLPHKVTRTFYARVIYKIVDGKPVIEEVGLSLKCLKYINDTERLAARIEDKLSEVARKERMLAGIHPTMASAIAPHINY